MIYSSTWTINTMSDEAAVLFTNDAFYNAFATRDLKALDALWSRNIPTVCVHPGWPPLYGRDSIMQSWATIFAGPNSPNISCQYARAHFLSREFCYVTCYELLTTSALVATNLFVKEANSWQLIHHHASPSARPPENSNVAKLQ